jgi:hypothetical protein
MRGGNAMYTIQELIAFSKSGAATMSSGRPYPDWVYTENFRDILDMSKIKSFKRRSR